MSPFSLGLGIDRYGPSHHALADMSLVALVLKGDHSSFKRKALF